MKVGMGSRWHGGQHVRSTRATLTTWAACLLGAVVLAPFAAAQHRGDAVWSVAPSGTTESLIGVWGASGRDVFAVGAKGTILHYDGKAWSAMSGGS